MGLCVLLSAMHLSDRSILEELNIKSDAVIINQCDSRGEDLSCEGSHTLFVSTTERGLSRSRNMAVSKAMDPAFDRDDICIFCDNDCVYEEHAEAAILSAFERYPRADIIVFFIERPERHSPVKKTAGPLGHAGAMKIFSPEIAFRKESIKKAKLLMDERFGAGADYGMGEENIFLFDALRLGLSVMYVPERIAVLKDTESTWFHGYDERYFVNRGAGYERMLPGAGFLLCWQFALRKRGLYRKETGFFAALSAMKKGRKEYKRRRIFVAGDYVTGTGPANATASLLGGLPCDTIRQKRRGKAARLLELIRRIPSCGVVLLSGHSKQNLHAIALARFFRKRVFFWMHGCVEHENAINGEPDESMNRVERKVLEGSDVILAVSPSFAAWLAEKYPEHEGKIGCLTNGVERVRSGAERGPDKGAEKRPDKAPADAKGGGINILSVGGGMIRKRMPPIARAVELLNREGMSCTLTIIGRPGGDSAQLAGFSHVRDLGQVDGAKASRLMESSSIFIQNSCFETFGLAPLEALTRGCSLLLSRHIGALCVFDRELVCEKDLIQDTEDVEEIAAGIRELVREPNHDRLLSAIDMDRVNWRCRAHELLDLTR